MGSPRFIAGILPAMLDGICYGIFEGFFLVGLPNDPLPFYGQILTREN